MRFARLVDTGRALTIRRPWIAALLLHGRSVEVRSKPPPMVFDGRRIWLHCAKTVSADDRADEQMLERAGFDCNAAAHWPGHIVGRATLRGHVVWQGALPASVSRSPWLTRLLPDRFRTDLSFIWRFEVERVRPVGPTPGQLGLWGVDDPTHRAALAGVIGYRREVLEEMLEPATWEIGELRARGTAFEVGRAGDRWLRVDPARFDLEVDSRGRLTRHYDIESFDDLQARVARTLERWGCSKRRPACRPGGQPSGVRP